MQQFLLAHAGALGQFVERVLTERAAELSRLDRLVLAGPDPGIDLLAGAAGGELADEIAEAADTLPAGTLVGTDGGGAAGEGAGAELPPNSLPRIKAPAATAIGVARLPPGTAFFRASSNIPIASSLLEVDRAPSATSPLIDSASLKNRRRRLPACVFPVHPATISEGLRLFSS